MNQRVADPVDLVGSVDLLDERSVGCVRAPQHPDGGRKLRRNFSITWRSRRDAARSCESSFARALDSSRCHIRLTRRIRNGGTILARGR